MGGSSVPSSTTTTTMLDPTRQAALKKSIGYFDKWADTYKGPTYKGPLTAGRTSDWYAAQNMAHKMANRFSEGGITSVRRFDDGGSTFSLTNAPDPSTSAASTAPDPSQFSLTMSNEPAPVDNTPSLPMNTFSFTPASTVLNGYAPTSAPYQTVDLSGITAIPQNDWNKEIASQANLEASAQNAGYQGDYTDTGAMQSYLDSQNARDFLNSEKVDVYDYTGDYAQQAAAQQAAAQQQAQQAIDKAAAQQWAQQQAVNYTYEPSSQQQLLDQALKAGYQGDYDDTGGMNSFLDSAALAAANTKVADTGLGSIVDKVNVVDTGVDKVNVVDTGVDKVNVADTGVDKVNVADTGLGSIVDKVNVTGTGKTPAEIAAEKAAKDAALQKAITDANLTPANVTPTVTSTNMGSPYLLGQALTLGGAGSAFRLGSDVSPKQIYNSYNTPDKFTPATWDKTAMDTYMSPYTQGVVDIALREAERQRGIERLRENTAATQSGAFGGYRQGVVEAEGERNYNQSRNDITTKGYQNAYTDAVAQFAADRAAKQTAYNANQQALQAAATGDISAGQYNQANKFQAFTNQLNALNQGVNNVQNLSALETAYQNAMGNAGAALTSTDASARADMQAQYEAIQKQLEAITNSPLFVAQSLSELAGLKNSNASTVVQTK